MWGVREGARGQAARARSGARPPHRVDEPQARQGRRCAARCRCRCRGCNVHCHCAAQRLAHHKEAPGVHLWQRARPRQHRLAVALDALLLWLAAAGAVAAVVPHDNVGRERGAQAVGHGQAQAHVAGVGVAQQQRGRLRGAHGGRRGQQPGVHGRAVRGAHKGLLVGQAAAPAGRAGAAAPLRRQRRVVGRRVVLHAPPRRAGQLRVVQHALLVAPQVVDYKEHAHEQQLQRAVH